MSNPRLIDMYSCAGGAARGYQRAGFHVTGYDIKPQPRYAGDVFVQGSALDLTPEYLRSYFDAIHASPPCQAHTAMKTMHNAKDHPDLVEPTRALLIASGLPWIMENVVGAPLENPTLLCGTMFGLGVEDAELRRHRLFETSFHVLAPNCQHGSRDVIGIYGGHIRNRRRARTIGIYGEGARDSRRKFDKGVPDFTTDQGRAAMGIDWMTTAELSQAIPPAYTEYLGRQLIVQLQQARSA
jgi:DNA (cytosine-5)-methyltransferase 1